MRIPSRPDLPAQILRGHGVVRFIHFHVAVTIGLAATLLEAGEPLTRNRQEARTFHFVEECPNLPARGTVDTRVGHRSLPGKQMLVLLGETLEGAAFERVG